MEGVSLSRLSTPLQYSRAAERKEGLARMEAALARRPLPFGSSKFDCFEFSLLEFGCFAFGCFVFGCFEFTL